MKEREAQERAAKLAEALTVARLQPTRRMLVRELVGYGADAILPILRNYDPEDEALKDDTELYLLDILSYIHQQTGPAPFLRLVRDKRVGPRLRYNLCDILANWRVEGLIPLLGELLAGSDDPEASYHYIIALGKTEDEIVLPILDEYAEHSDERVALVARFWAAMIRRETLPAFPPGLDFEFKEER